VSPGRDFCTASSTELVECVIPAHARLLARSSGSTASCLGCLAAARTLVEGETESKWAGDDWGGCIVAEGVVTNFMERARAPCFGTANAKIGKELFSGLFLVVGFVYMEDSPDVDLRPERLAVLRTSLVAIKV
jgi:hypothetical protein